MDKILKDISTSNNNGITVNPVKAELKPLEKFELKLLDSGLANQFRQDLNTLANNNPDIHRKKDIVLTQAVVEVQAGDNKKALEFLDKIPQIKMEEDAHVLINSRLQSNLYIKNQMDELIMHEQKKVDANDYGTFAKLLELKENINQFSPLQLASEVANMFQEDRVAENLIAKIRNTEQIMAENEQQTVKLLEDNYEKFFEQFNVVHAVVSENLQRIEKKAENGQLLILNPTVDELGDIKYAAEKQIAEENKGYLGYILGGLKILGGVALIAFGNFPCAAAIGMNLVRGGIDLAIENYEMNLNNNYKMSNVLLSAGAKTLAAVASPLFAEYCAGPILE